MMNKMITALASLSLALGTAACASTPQPVSSAATPSSYAALGSGNATTAGTTDAANPNVPGATGRTIVPGDNSTIAGDAEATEMFRTGSYGR
jgi:hypothetical protein